MDHGRAHASSGFPRSDRYGVGIAAQASLRLRFPITTLEGTMDGLRRVNTILEGTKLPPVPLDEVEATIHRDSLSLLGLAHD